ncbi:uncharacterized protein B0H18DRAFT_1000910 [Fomitopsis serialis]|uniref:uncharacterized protein n=1 Tax=Fomitopsis serialis TaxID=139415 RepID=UPI00200897FC|nr:uncharacterized protein B0H18DRAFT_1000910 [Neoantrodia serialis]KAH9928348.1 hypothetical protein B0H18DRAFT_1000910 [Neoantrodia serialis]
MSALLSPIVLRRAARRLKEWVSITAPGARVIICGSDMALDFSKCSRPTLANTLKDKARLSDQFVVGFEVFLKLDDATTVQLDFVDAPEYYFQPSEADSVVISLPDDPTLEVLSPPTLLVHKIIAKVKRKQQIDCSDIGFLLALCANGRHTLLPVHGNAFRGRQQEIMNAFVAVAGETMAPGRVARYMCEWNGLVVASGLDGSFYMV